MEGYNIKRFILDKRVLFLEILLSIFLYIKFDLGLLFIGWVILFYLLLVLTFIDYEYKAVPDYLLLSVFVLAPFLAENLIDFIKNSCMFAGGFVLLNFIITFYIQNIKSRIKNDPSLQDQIALGEGDIPIVAIIGGLLGIKLGFLAIVIGSFVALGHGIYNSYKSDNETPYIPYLVIGFISVVLIPVSKFEEFFLWVISW